jgi:hypothetical protein
MQEKLVKWWIITGIQLMNDPGRRKLSVINTVRFVARKRIRTKENSFNNEIQKYERKRQQ